MHIRISLCIKFHFEQTILNFWTKFAQERYLWSKTEKVNIIIEFRIFKLVSWYQISALTDNFDFLDQICPKRVFLVKNRKSEHHHWIPLIQISLGTKFQLKLTILIFWPDLPKKGFSGLKQKKWTPHIFYIILHIQISLVRNFSSNWQFDFLDEICPKIDFQSKTVKVIITMEFCIF